MKNQDIRNAAADSGVKHWQIAETLGMADTTFCRKLRKELDPEMKDRIFTVIKELAKEA